MQPHRHAEAIATWCARYDTPEIALPLNLPEHEVAHWVANFREHVKVT